MTRKRDGFWEYAERLNGRFRCNFCNRDFAGGIPRVKSHLSGIKGRDIDICTKVPKDVQLAAAATIKDAHKRPKTEAFSSNSDENSSEVCEKNDSNMLDDSLAKFLLLNNIDCSVVKSPSFVDFVNAVAAFGPAYNLPSYSTLNSVVIPNLLGEVKADVSKVKESWGENGCTLISDVWSDDEENKSFINIIAYSCKGAVLLHTIQVPKKTLSSDFLELLISFSIQTIGASNVVQYINGAQSVGPIGSLLPNDYPHVYTTRCVAAEIQSLFEEVYNEIEWVRVTFGIAERLVSSIYRNSNLLALTRKHTSNKELRRPQPKEFSSNYNMMLSLIEVRSELVGLIESPEWLSFDYETRDLVEEVAEIIRSPGFWSQVQEIAVSLESLYMILYLVERCAFSSAYLYGAMEIATEKMRKIYDVDPNKYQRLWEIFDSWKDKIVHPIHVAAAFLNPVYMYTEMYRDKAKAIEVMDFLVRNLVVDEDKEAFVKQMMEYHTRESHVFSDAAKIMFKTSHPCEWWDYCGHKLPVLRKYAIRVLSQPCSTLACRQSLSAFRSAQIKQQPRFSLEAPYDQLSLKMNMILTAKLRTRNTSREPIDLRELGMMKWTGQSLSNNFLHDAEDPGLGLLPSQRLGSTGGQYEGKKCQLQFITKISPLQFTGQEVKGEHGSTIHVFVVDPVTGDLVQDDRFSLLKLTVSALHGDFDEEARNIWTEEDFNENEIKDVPLMTGDLQVTLKNGMGTVGAFTFNYDSTIARSGKFKLGVKVVRGDGDEVLIQGGISNAFVVKYADEIRRRDAAVNQTRTPEDSPPASIMGAPLWSPLQGIFSDTGTTYYNEFFEPMWNTEATYNYKLKKAVKFRQAARRIVLRKRAQRMDVWFRAQKRLDEWSKGEKWTNNEHSMFLKGLQELGKRDWKNISEKYVKSKTPTQVESHARKYFRYRSRLGIKEEKEDTLLLLEPHWEEGESYTHTGSSVVEFSKFAWPDISQQVQSLTLFPTLLTGDAEPKEDGLCKVGTPKLEKPEQMRTTNQSAGESYSTNLNRSSFSDRLTLFPSLLTKDGDGTVEEDFVMVTASEPMLSTRPIEVDESSGTSTLTSAQSSEMDWEMIPWNPSEMLDDGMRKSKYENDQHKIAQGKRHQLSNEPSASLYEFWKRSDGGSEFRLKALERFSSPKALEPPSEILSLISLERPELSCPDRSNIALWQSEKFLRQSRYESHIKRARQFTLRDLEIATNSFSQENVISENAYAVTYRGNMAHGMAISVKKLLNNSGLSEEEFRVEVESIGLVRHKNFVRLLGYCIEGTNRLLVYENVSNTNLEQLLHEPLHQQRPLSWENRMKIVWDVARALLYLHEGVEPRVAHRDIKCANILIDKDFNAKISDFGIAKLHDAGNSRVGTRSDDTSKCLHPGHDNSGLLDQATDVYNFGFVFLETIMRQVVEVPDSVKWLVYMVRNDLLEKLVDCTIESPPSKGSLLKAAMIVLKCLDPDAKMRPKMSTVLRMLEMILDGTGDSDSLEWLQPWS